MQWPKAGLFVMRTARRLAVNRHDFSGGGGGHGLHPSHEAFLKCGRFEGGKDARKGIVRWDTVVQSQEGFMSFFFTVSELFHLGEVFGPAHRRPDSKRDDADSRRD